MKPLQCSKRGGSLESRYRAGLEGRNLFPPGPGDSLGKCQEGGEDGDMGKDGEGVIRGWSEGKREWWGEDEVG